MNLHPCLTNLASGEAKQKVVVALKKFVGVFQDFTPSVVLLYLRSNLLSEEAFAIIRSFDCPVVGLNLDDQTEFNDFPSFSSAPRNYRKWATYFDVNLTSSRKVLDWYRAAELPVYYMPEGFRRFKGLDRPVSKDFDYGLTFLGSSKLERISLVEELRNRGVTVSCFGSGWIGGQWVEDPSVVFRRSLMNLGIGTSFPLSRLTSLKARDFECPGVGGCYLTQYNWELTEHYILGEEILCYSSIEELIEIYSYYRSRPEECLKIAQAGWDRCSGFHTWEKRFRDFFVWFSGVRHEDASYL